MKRFNITVNGQTYEVEVQEVSGAAASKAAPAPVAAPIPAASKAVPVPTATPVQTPKVAAPVPVGANTITAPMPGKILAVNVKAGDSVKRGDVLLILEAMKMQNEIMAPADGKISDIRVAVGQIVANGDVMVVLGS